MSSWMSEYVDAWNSHNGERVAAFMADDVVYEDLALRQIHEGREAIIGFVQASEEFSKDHKFVLVSEQTSGDRYAFEWEMIGTNTGESGGLPGTRRKKTRGPGEIQGPGDPREKTRGPV